MGYVLQVFLSSPFGRPFACHAVFFYLSSLRKEDAPNSDLKPDLSDLTHTGGRKIGPLILFVMPGFIETDARWNVVLDAFNSLGAP